MSSYQWPPQGSGSGGGVTSLNTLTGAVVLVAGSNITLTPSGNNITIASTASGSGSVTSVSVVSANGFAGTVATATTTPAITLTTTITGLLKGNGTAISAATAGTDYSAGTSALGTGILKSTTGTGALTIAVAADFPTLNQNTTGTAANITATTNSTLTTLSSLSLPGSQVTGNIAGNAANITATSNSTLTTLSALSLPGSQVSSAVANATLAATVTTNANLTGPVTSVGNATSVTNNAITNAMRAQMATLTIKGNNTGGTANEADLTVAQVNAILPVFNSTLNGLAPLSGGGTTNFLRADGTWTAPTAAQPNPIVLSQISTPAAPSAGSDSLYFKSGDGLYIQNSAGLETQLTSTLNTYEWSGFHNSTNGNSWSRASATFGDFTNADTSITLTQNTNSNFGTVTGYGASSGASALPGLVFSPPITGNYFIKATVPVNINTATAQLIGLRLYDITGSSIIDGAPVLFAASQTIYSVTFAGIINYSSTASKTISIQGASAMAGTFYLDNLIRSGVSGGHSIEWSIFYVGTTSPVSSNIANIRTVTTNYTLIAADSIVLVNSTGATTMTLPAPVTGTIYNIKNINTGTVTITPTSGTIDGSASATMPVQYTSLELTTDGTNWFVI